MTRIGKPALGYIALYALALVFGFAFSDAVQSSVLIGFWALAPIVSMAIVWHAYATGRPRPQAVAASAQPGPAPFAAAQPPAEPYFSGFAIAGAVWALFGLLTIIPILYFIGLNRVWKGTALPTDVIHTEPPLYFTVFMGALLPIGAGAPIGATVFGSLAIQRIKRSSGRIRGLPLAVADVILFPLLILGGITGTLTHGAQAAIWAKEHTGYVYKDGNLINIIAPDPATRPDMIFLILDVLTAQLVWFFAGRALWRATVGREVAGSPTRPQPPAAFACGLPLNESGERDFCGVTL